MRAYKGEESSGTDAVIRDGEIHTWSCWPVGRERECVFTDIAFDSSLAIFKDNVQWIKNVCSLTIPVNKTTSPAEENWSLIVEYLKLSEEADDVNGGETLEERKLILGNKRVA